MPHTPVPPLNRHRARSMRRRLTEAELKLWNVIRAHRLCGLSFRRQMPIAGYIVDFACPAHKMIVELDGSHHGDAVAAASDGARSERLRLDGWTILRFWNDDVLRDIDGVCQHIVTTAGHSPRQTEERRMIDHKDAFVLDPDGNNVEAVCHAPGKAAS